MQNLILIPVAVFSLMASATEFQWKSVYTNIKTDCVIISASTEHAEIDFAEEECKAFGGYQLHIAGGDIRYNPVLNYHGLNIDLQVTGAFHDIASDNIEWVYRHKMDRAGQGEIQWRGLIYRLSISDKDDGSSRSALFAVRLDGTQSCVIGETTSNEEARKMVYNSRANCR